MLKLNGFERQIQNCGLVRTEPPNAKLKWFGKNENSPNDFFWMRQNLLRRGFGVLSNRIHQQRNFIILPILREGRGEQLPFEPNFPLNHAFLNLASVPGWRRPICQGGMGRVQKGRKLGKWAFCVEDNGVKMGIGWGNAQFIWGLWDGENCVELCAIWNPMDKGQLFGLRGSGLELDDSFKVFYQIFFRKMKIMKKNVFSNHELRASTWHLYSGNLTAKVCRFSCLGGSNGFGGYTWKGIRKA